MYSVVLMAALTSGSATPDWGLRGNGCYGGCYGSCYGGCFGGGGLGLRRAHGCNGGCYGGCYGSHVVSSGCHGCYGSVPNWSCHGGCYGYSGISPYHPIMPGIEKVPPPDIKKKDEKKQDESTSSRAMLVVELPANAKLYIDDQPMKTTSAKRTFQTPPLQPGQLYYYLVRVEVVRDGEVKTETRRVIIRPGEEARASFPNLESPATTTAQAR